MASMASKKATSPPPPPHIAHYVGHKFGAPASLTSNQKWTLMSHLVALDFQSGVASADVTTNNALPTQLNALALWAKFT